MNVNLNSFTIVNITRILCMYVYDPWVRDIHYALLCAHMLQLLVLYVFPVGKHTQWLGHAMILDLWFLACTQSLTSSKKMKAQTSLKLPVRT